MGDSGDRGSATGPPFNVRVIGVGERGARVLAAGELDLATSPTLDRALTDAIADSDDVVLDLANVTFIDSTGLSTILAGVSASQLSGGRLVISSTLAAQPRRLFELAGMDRTLPLADD